MFTYPGCNGLVLPADIFISVQVQGQIVLMSGISELLLYKHTLPNSARLATSCLQEPEPLVDQPWHRSPALLPLFWLVLLGWWFCVRQEPLDISSVLQQKKTHYLAKDWMHGIYGQWPAGIHPHQWADPSIWRQTIAQVMCWNVICKADPLSYYQWLHTDLNSRNTQILEHLRVQHGILNNCLFLKVFALRVATSEPEQSTWHICLRHSLRGMTEKLCNAYILILKKSMW